MTDPTVDKIEPRGLDVVFYTTQDLRRARNFYENLFELTTGVQSDHWVEYDLPDGSTFALAHDPVGGWSQGNGLMFGVKNVDEAVARAKSLGGEVLDRKFESPGCRAAGIKDTEGNFLYLHERK
jgi:predicted enzyme related to lactoylglutathione lyase